MVFSRRGVRSRGVPSAGFVDFRRGERNPDSWRIQLLLHRHPAGDLSCAALCVRCQGCEGALWRFAPPRVFRMEAVLAQNHIPGFDSGRCEPAERIMLRRHHGSDGYWDASESGRRPVLRRAAKPFDCPDLFDRRDCRQSRSRRDRLGHPLLCMGSSAGRLVRLCDALRRERPTGRRVESERHRDVAGGNGEPIVCRPCGGGRPDCGAPGCLCFVELVPSRRSGQEMKSLLRIERVALIRWSMLAFVAVLLLPLFFLRYGSMGAVAQSAMVMALPITTAGLVFSHARVPRSYRSFSIHDRLLLRFTLKSLLLGVAVSICLTLLYGFAVGFIVNKRPLSLHVALMFAFTAVVLSLACFVLRLWASPVVAWSIVGFFIVAGLPVSSGMFEGSPILHAVIPTTWMLSGARFAGYVIPVGVVVAMASAWLLLKAVKRV